MTDTNHRRIFRPLNDPGSRQLYNRLYRQFALREVYRANHFYDDRKVIWTMETLLKHTRKVEGVMYRGNDREWYAKFS